MAATEKNKQTTATTIMDLQYQILQPERGNSLYLSIYLLTWFDQMTQSRL